MDSHSSRLADILDAIQGIRNTVQNADFEHYQTNWTMRFATERAVEVISEASRHIPKEVKDKHPEIPWRAIANIGNKLRHEYQRVDNRIIWLVAHFRLDELERFCQEELAVLRRNRAQPQDHEPEGG